MRAVIQRVKQAKVEVGGEAVGAIKKGFLVLLAIHKDDTEEKIEKLADKIIKLRVFEDENQKMNLALGDVDGEILVISQFTLYGDALNGNRPSFLESAKAEMAEPFYESFIQVLKNRNIKTEKGRFGEYMQVSLINDGPVTIIIDI